MYVDRRASAAKWRTIVGVVPHLKVYGFEEEVSPAPGPTCRSRSRRRTISSFCCAARFRRKRWRNRCGKSSPRSIPRNPSSSFAPCNSGSRKPGPRRACSRSSSSIFAGLACILAVVGIYGVISYNGLRRTREIGVRLALGARRRPDRFAHSRPRRRVCSQSVLLVGFGAAFALSRVMRSVLFGVSATDPLIFLAVSLLLGCAAVIACWIPARSRFAGRSNHHPARRMKLSCLTPNQ